MKKKLTALLFALIFSVILIGCSSKTETTPTTNITTTPVESSHQHTFSQAWSSDSKKHYYLATCGHDVRSDEENHIYGDWITITEATETTKGSKKQVCSVCGYENVVEISELSHNHTYSSSWSYDTIKHWHSSTCGHDVKSDERIHVYGDWITILEATETTKSSKKQVCSVCGYENIVEIPIIDDITSVISFDLNGGKTNSSVDDRIVTNINKNDFFFDVIKENNVFRGWSYNGIKVFDENGNIIENVKMMSNMTFVAIYSKMARINITSNILNAGEITSSCEALCETELEIFAHPYVGYEFAGWYINDEIVSKQELYKISIHNFDIDIQAHFIMKKYSITVMSYQPNYGDILLQGTCNDYIQNCSDKREFLSEVTIDAKTKKDINFLGWYDSENRLISSDKLFSFEMPNSDYVIIAKWNKFKIEYEGDFDYIDSDALGSYDYHDNYLTLPNAYKQGYNFNGWEYNGEIYNVIDCKALINYLFVAKFSPSKNTKYKVYHYKQTLNDDYLDIPDDIDELFGETNSEAYAMPKKYEGFGSPSVETMNILADGSTIVKLYYPRSLYSLVILKNLSNAATITYNRQYKYGTSVSISVNLNDGYNFLGWFKNAELLSSDLIYTFIMPAKDENIDANFEKRNDVKYVINHYQQDINGKYPAVAYEIETKYGVTEELTEAYAKEYIGFSALSFSQKQINGDGTTNVNIYYERNIYQIEISIIYTNTDVDKIIKNCKYESVLNLTEFESGYTLNKVYDSKGDEYGEFSYKLLIPNFDLNIEFSANRYKVRLDTSYVTCNSKQEYEVIFGRSYSFPVASNNTKKLYSTIFDGWSYNSVKITNSYGYVSKWNINDDVILTPEFIIEDIISFGYYPQTIVNDNNLIEKLKTRAGELPTSKDTKEWIDYGYYFDDRLISYMYYIDIDLNDDGKKDYRGVYFLYARPYDTVMVTSTGSSSLVSYQYQNNYFKGNIYWFKYEPIKWEVINNVNGAATIISEKLLDCQDYHYTDKNSVDSKGTYYASNYMLSHVKSWLNTFFYETAFNDAEKEIIKITNVDNSAASIDESNNNGYICKNTNDKIYLASKKEVEKFYINANDRIASGSDYAKCQGLYVKNNYSEWLLRSPYNARKSYVVSLSGTISSDYVTHVRYGIRPVCRIKL